MGPLPQHFADQFGWEAMARTSPLGILHPHAGRAARRAIYASNYGEAGAIDFFGDRLGIPRAVSGTTPTSPGAHAATGAARWLVAVGASREELLKIYEDVRQAGETSQPYAMPFENHVPIFIRAKAEAPRRGLLAVSTKLYI